jgi:non-homologous end joining protein Ku
MGRALSAYSKPIIATAEPQWQNIHLHADRVFGPYAIIAKKAAQSQVAASSQTHVAAAPVVDILEALKKSLAMAKKPAASEPQTLRKAPGRVTEIKSKRQSRKAR